MNTDRRVVITGLGVVTPVGNDLETFWAALKEGKSGIGRITAFDIAQYDCQIAGEVRNFDPKPFFKIRKTSAGQIVSFSSRWARRRCRCKTAGSTSKK